MAYHGRQTGTRREGTRRVTGAPSKVKASSEAIISAPALLDDYYGEEEYIANRRRLSVVKVLERFSQTSIDAPRAKGA